MNSEELKNLWKQEERQFFAGWDFSHLAGRWENEALPWSYDKLVRGFLKPDTTLLDIGTGGGEYLLSLNHPYSQTSVTEGYEPNVRLCRERLEPFGITVAQTFENKKLPFNDESFSLIINRHEDYSCDEILRVLKPGGIFVTQQVGCKNNNDLSKRLLPGFTPQITKTFSDYRSELLGLSFRLLESAEFFPVIKFFDIGALVYFAKIIEWEFPGFSVEKCFDVLCEMHREVCEKGFVCGTEHRFILAAQK